MGVQPCITWTPRREAGAQQRPYRVLPAHGVAAELPGTGRRRSPPSRRRRSPAGSRATPPPGRRSAAARRSSPAGRRPWPGCGSSRRRGAAPGRQQPAARPGSAPAAARRPCSSWSIPPAAASLPSGAPSSSTATPAGVPLVGELLVGHDPDGRAAQDGRPGPDRRADPGVEGLGVQPTAAEGQHQICRRHLAALDRLGGGLVSGIEPAGSARIPHACSHGRPRTKPARSLSAAIPGDDPACTRAVQVPVLNSGGHVRSGLGASNPGS